MNTPMHLFCRISVFLLVSFGAVLLTACSGEQGPSPRGMEMASAPEAAQRMVASDRMAAQKAENPYLALEHYFRIELPEDAIRERFEATVERCAQENFYGCTLVDASLNEDDYSMSANIQVRIQTEGVDPLISTAAQDGEITSQNSRAEDLTEVVTDVDERLEMLRSYRERLQALEESAAGDVESLIKVNSELARIQSEIEQLQSNRDYLQKRLDLDLLNIHLYSDRRDNFLAPIEEAFDRFIYHLASGTSSIVTAIAWALPWAIALALIVLVFRLLRRRRK
ncbi:DUF4349 domain-containing protein [Proteobacteria bacterium 005FR1]|nr:DUF4349 domain-containing protein [Proteobacteria bacterium 005FR1]